MTTTQFFAVKGGQGTTVAAAVFALGLSGHVLLGDHAESHDLPGVFGVRMPQVGDRVRVHEALDIIIGDGTPGYDHVVNDNGTNRVPRVLAGERVLCVRCDYLSLQAVVRSNPVEYDRIVALKYPGTALTGRDVETTLGKPTTVVEYDPAIARAVDAGLLSIRVLART